MSNVKGRRWFAAGYQAENGQFFPLTPATALRHYADAEAAAYRKKEAAAPGGNPELIVTVTRLELPWELLTMATPDE